jgi:hypothetical protein
VELPDDGDRAGGLVPVELDPVLGDGTGEVDGGVATAGPGAIPWTGVGAPVGVTKIGGEAPCTGDILGLPIGLCAAAATHIDEMSNIIITPLVTAAILLVEVLK